MTIDLNLPAMRAVAEAATQGEWQSTGSLIHTALSARVIASTESSDFFALDNLKNSAHITTFDPPTALALIARAEQAEAALAAMTAERDRATHLLRSLANIAWHIRTNHPGWDHDDFQLSIGNESTSLAPFRAARNLLERTKP